MATKKYLDYAGLKRVLKHLLPGHRKIWHGTEAEWNALSAAERDKYDQAEIESVTTDAYEDGYHTFDPTKTVEGLTITPVNNVPCSYFRQGQLLIVNFHAKVNGTCTESIWHEYYDPADFIRPDEFFYAPWFIQVGKGYTTTASARYRILSGRYFGAAKDEVVNNEEVDYQVIYLVNKR